MEGVNLITGGVQCKHVCLWEKNVSTLTLWLSLSKSYKVVTANCPYRISVFIERLVQMLRSPLITTAALDHRTRQASALVNRVVAGAPYFHEKAESPGLGRRPRLRLLISRLEIRLLDD